MSKITVFWIGARLKIVETGQYWEIDGEYVENLTGKRAAELARELAEREIEQTTGAVIDSLIAKRLEGSQLRDYLIDNGQLELNIQWR